MLLDVLKMVNNDKTAIIIGAGPAGLTAAYELLDKTDIKPIIYEKSEKIGGISKTIKYKGNRLDIGPHRYYSKSDRVVDWWTNILPLQGAPAIDDLAIGRAVSLSDKAVRRDIGSDSTRTEPSPNPEKEDNVLLNRSRLTRIFFLRKFFDYPVSLNYDTLSNLGFTKTTKIGLSYIKTVFNKINPEKTLEDFFINRFGRELYQTFFKDYTEKVWGVPCHEITAEWGAQRIKGLSIIKTITHAMKESLKRGSTSQKKVETSLIGNFMYPQLGSGQMWEEVARIIEENGGKIYKKHQITGIRSKNDKITGVDVLDVATGEVRVEEGDYLFSTMPVCELIESFQIDVPDNVQKVANGLIYRDLILVGLLLDKMKLKNESNIPSLKGLVPDQWIYIQERNVKLGRLDIFNNFSPRMVKDEGKIWLGLEYFCNEGDDLWNMSEEDFIAFAIAELAKIDIIESTSVQDSMLVREKKTYPAYFGTYADFNVIRKFTDNFSNLFLIGRNGMHRYNNMDHSMLTAMVAVENIKNRESSKDNIWEINAEEDYHEEK